MRNEEHHFCFMRTANTSIHLCMTSLISTIVIYLIESTTQVKFKLKGSCRGSADKLVNKLAGLLVKLEVSNGH